MNPARDLLELSHHLKQERLFVEAELSHLRSLNKEIQLSAKQLHKTTWITRKQYQNLVQLILGDRSITPELCCFRANSYEKLSFVQAHKCLSYHESKIGEFFKFLHENPKVMAMVLIKLESEGSDFVARNANIVTSSVYGNMVMMDDVRQVLKLLRWLLEFQVKVSADPRRMLCKGSCTFSHVFRLLSESLFTSRLFLTAALNQPIIQLLTEEEWFYDIDPERALHRFPPAERLKRFSAPDTLEYKEKTTLYREKMVCKLVSFAERFMHSIKNSMHCFPESLSWLVCHLHRCVASVTDNANAWAMCTDLVFTSFICPAICDPEAYGITSDAPISYIARHNLMQVGQILQVLAVSSVDEVDTKVSDIYRRFDRSVLTSLIDTLLQQEVHDTLSDSAMHAENCIRSCSLITASDLDTLLSSVRNVTIDNEHEEEKQLLADALRQLPTQAQLEVLKEARDVVSPVGTNEGAPTSTPKRRQNRNKHRLIHAMADLSLTLSDEQERSQFYAVNEHVLMISVASQMECLGMIPESKVLEQSQQRKDEAPSTGEKKTRFSLSSDHDAHSDNLEAISEAASSHSTGSDDLEDAPEDNLSDMVSANVSGRGTPNFSGRDTPSSHVSSQPEQSEGTTAPQSLPATLPIIVQKTNREDVTDRFGKFDIKNELERDETKSTVSDSWSTDVLASDSEAADQSQVERLAEVAEEMRQNLLGVVDIGDMLETASDAWSTDVLHSDTSERQSDRLLELDTDDVLSISSRSGPAEDVGARGDDPNNSSLLMFSNDTPRTSDNDLSYRGMLHAPRPLISQTKEDIRSSCGESNSTSASSGLQVSSNSAFHRYHSSVSHQADQNNSSGARPKQTTKSLVDMDGRIVMVNGSVTIERQLSGDSDRNQSTSTGQELPRNIRPVFLLHSKDDDDGKKKHGLFRNIKEKISKSGKKKMHRSEEERARLATHVTEADDRGSPGRRGSREEESSDDILAKYRKLTSCSNIAQSSAGAVELEEEPLSPAFNPHNLESCRAFQDAKRKLRVVLSSADVHSLPQSAISRDGAPLLSFLHLLLAEAINLQQKDLIAQLHETIRCLHCFDPANCLRLMKVMREEYRARAPYISYLVSCRQKLLTTLSHLQRMTARINRDKIVCQKYLLSVLVRLFLERNDAKLHHFMNDFQSCKMSDEKVDCLERFLLSLHDQMNSESSWQAGSAEQRAEALVYIERNVLSRIYAAAMFPNGEADLHRDQILQEHIGKLSKIIFPGHPDLRINRMFHDECPWPSAQAELTLIGAHRTPRDKLECVVRCCCTIMNLLSLASEKNTPSADHFTPVFLFVIIKANPPNLLSTVEFVSSMYSCQLTGEQQYWWTNFKAAIEFIKTMDYKCSKPE